MTTVSGAPASDPAQGPPLAPSLGRVARGDLCSGCGGCAALVPGKIAMQRVAEGFLRPRQSVSLTDAEDAALTRVCPGLGQSVQAGGRTDDALWGPYLQMWTGHATDAALRHAGASGGGLSALALHLVESGQVDGVIQTAAAPGLPLGNVTVLSPGRPGILAAAGSRYAPASPLAGLDAWLQPGRRYAFVGKPCVVAALRLLAQERPEIAAAIPVM
ncbi:MAG: coenzyme F420 hydrogenase/dehydrogenase beta subunit N-terminal domain-containing protein, partial [Gemmobacter sp.]